MSSDPLRALVARWREDAGGTYRSWFLWEERLKNFRSIRRGLRTVVEEIEAGTFGTAYRDSSLEIVVSSIAEQRQVFRGADHAFLWKPKLRIPDIYESPDNQRAFGRFLDVCACRTCAEDVVAAIHELDGKAIKGLGPAAANLLYFLHPTLVPPFNTAIVKGYNALTGSKVKLGSGATTSRCARASRGWSRPTAICCPTTSARSPGCCSTSATDGIGTAGRRGRGGARRVGPRPRGGPGRGRVGAARAGGPTRRRRDPHPGPRLAARPRPRARVPGLGRAERPQPDLRGSRPL